MTTLVSRVRFAAALCLRALPDGLRQRGCLLSDPGPLSRSASSRSRAGFPGSVQRHSRGPQLKARTLQPGRGGSVNQRVAARHPSRAEPAPAMCGAHACAPSAAPLPPRDRPAAPGLEEQVESALPLPPSAASRLPCLTRTGQRPPLPLSAPRAPTPGR